ncbi:MAG TPA: hypothetical protein VFI57_13160 [Pyrinomonadaceae bacterium]|nr:hypothetical protein [Pyrinomonadaceae bacterium]
MNEDYLWDKSGEPDPEIQELEELLAPFSYQPKPLELPHEVRRRSYLPLLAIAAAILIAVVIGGIWIRVRTASTPQQEQAKDTPPAPVFKNTDQEEIHSPIPNKPVPQKRRVRNSSSNLALARRQHEEALAAKEQVMLALRLASEKLKLAQRRTQGPSPNQIKNQHKVG